MKRLLVMLPISLMLNGCASGPNSPAPNDGVNNARYCNVYSPVFTSTKDTEETKRQVDGNNAKYEKLC